MSHHKNRGLKFLQGLGYVGLSILSGVATIFLASLTIGLASTIIGIPLAVLTAMGTGACAVGTVYFAVEAGDKFVCAFEHDDHVHHHDKITIYPLSAYFDKKQIKEIKAHLKSETDLKGSSKAFFVPASEKASNAPEIDNIPSDIHEERLAAKASM